MKAERKLVRLRS